MKYSYDLESTVSFNYDQQISDLSTIISWSTFSMNYYHMQVTD